MKKLTVALGVLLVICAAGAVQGWRELRAQRLENAALAERVTTLESAAQAPAMAEAPAREAPAPEVLTREVLAQQVHARSAATTESSSAPAVPAATAPAVQADPMMTAAMQLLSTPAGQEMTRAMMRTMMREQYPDLQARLGLSTEEADRLYELLAKHASELTLESMQASTDGVDPFARLGVDMDNRERANDREIEALLGADFRKWKDYELETQQRDRERYTQQGIDRLRAAVNTTGTPMADDRFTAFREAVEAEQRQFERATPIQSMQQYAQQLPEMNRRLLAVAANHLDSVQLEGYQRYLKQQEDSVRMMYGMTGGSEGASIPAAPR